MKTFDNVASLKLARLNANQFVETGGFTEKGGTGAKRYFTKTASQAAADGDVVDDVHTNFVLANGIVAIDTSKPVIEHYTLAEAKALAGAVIGQIIQITDRGNAKFKYIASTTNNEFDMIDAVGSGLTLSLIEDALNPIFLGAISDNSTPATSEFNRAGEIARETLKTVQISGEFLLDGKVNFKEVSAVGLGAKLRWVVDAAEGSCLEVGGSNKTIRGLDITMSNTDPDTNMQGVYFPVNDAHNFIFTENIVKSLTIRSGAEPNSNVYGLWMNQPVNCKNIVVTDNVFVNVYFGIWINAQTTPGQNLGTAEAIIIANNVCEGAQIGINTPNMTVRDVVVSNNVVEPADQLMRIPVSFAHTTNLTITGNIIQSNNGTDSVMHLEDISERFAVTGNRFYCTTENKGVFLSQIASVSGGVSQICEGVVNGNVIINDGTKTNQTDAGIMINDNYSGTVTISNNYIQNFYTGMLTSDSTSNLHVTGNVMKDCIDGFNSIRAGKYADNTLIDCVNCITGLSMSVTMEGLRLVRTPLNITKAVANTLAHFVNVTQVIESFPYGASTDIAPLTYEQDMRVVAHFFNDGFVKHSINWNSVTLTDARLARAQLGTLGTISFAENSGNLQMITAGSGSGDAEITFDSFVM